MLRFAAAAVAAALLAGCSTTPAELEAKTPPVTQVFKENYQEIYRRVATTAKRCFAGNVSAYASIAVDSELYSELGYGELSISLINLGVRNYYVTARVEKQPQGSLLTLRAGNTLAAPRYVERIQAWANGDQQCPMF